MGEVVSQGQPPADPKQSIRIPIIVENKRAYSYDVFISPDGKFFPLNEARVAAMMFQSSPYAEAPPLKGMQGGGGSAASQNMDPSMPASAHGGQNPASSTMGKMGSVLDLVHIEGDAVDTFLNSVATDSTLLDAAKINEDFSSSLSKLSHAAKISVPDTDAGPSLDSFDSAVISKVAGGYRVIGATHSPFNQAEFFIGNRYSETIPVELRQGIAKHGSVLLTGNDHELLEVEPSFGLEEADETGVYSVMSKEGGSQKAVVLKDVVALSGRKLDSTIVVGPSGASLQEKVAGIRCGDVSLDALVGSEPLGEGVFFLKAASAVTEPLEIKHTVESSDGRSYIYEHALYGRGTLKVAKVVKPVQVSGTDYLIPEDSVFVPMPLSGENYLSDTVAINKIASRHDEMKRVRILSDGSEFTFSGGPVSGIEKVAKLSCDDALLIVGLLGDTPDGALEKVAAAASSGEVSFVATRNLVKESVIDETDEEVVKLASVIRLNLVKEAAALVGADTVDSVLSLNFITPENVAGYLDAMPVFEESASKLAELLIGVRLGLSDVPEAAVASALSGIERAVQGLKKLQIRTNVAI
tara:strand:- start:17447 stop:19192 length:1746 start_codon:yes stop_codon:yes gene_type:complete